MIDPDRIPGLRLGQDRSTDCSDIHKPVPEKYAEVFVFGDGSMRFVADETEWVESDTIVEVRP